MQIRFPFAAPPAPGTMTEIAEGVLWGRVPLPIRLDHVNIYALDDGDGWTVVDTGFDDTLGQQAWAAFEAGPLRGRPVRRVVATHHHVDHIGRAGWFQARGAELVATRTAWLYARMLWLDRAEVHPAEAVAFWRGAGMAGAALDRRVADRPFNSADVAAPLPLGYTRIVDGQVLRMGGRDWLVRTGDGHAPEHATFWSLSDGLIIGGDQLLPGISANIGVYPAEPDADPLGEWLAACRRFQPLAEPHHLVLPGHKLPFTGLTLRLRQMIDNHLNALDRLESHLAVPRRAVECFTPIFGREIEGGAYGLALAEAVAHLNHLWRAGRAVRWRDGDGAWLWQAQAGDVTA